MIIWTNSKWRPAWIYDRHDFSYFWSESPQCFLPSFESTGLSVQEKKRKIDFQDGCHGGHLGYRIGTILAIFDLQVTPMSPTIYTTNPNGLNNLGRGSPKEQFCKIILKSVQWFRTRRFFKFLVKKSILNSCDLDMQWTGTIWTTLKEDQSRIIPVKFAQIPTSGLAGDVV